MNLPSLIGWAAAAVPLAFQVWMAVHAVRSGRPFSWLWIILLLGPIGAAVYFFVEYLPSSGTPNWFTVNRVRSRELDVAEADTRRLDTAHAWTHYAVLLRGRRRHRDAELAARRALERKPDDVEALYELGRALLPQKQTREALEALDQVVRRERLHDGGDALLALGQAHEVLGNHLAARAAFEEMAAQTSRPEVLCYLAELQARTGAKDDARRTYQRVLDDAEYAPAFGQRRLKPWLRRARAGLKDLGG